MAVILFNGLSLDPHLPLSIQMADALADLRGKNCFMAYFPFRDKIGEEKAGHLSRTPEQLKERKRKKEDTSCFANLE